MNLETLKGYAVSDLKIKEVLYGKRPEGLTARMIQQLVNLLLPKGGTLKALQLRTAFGLTWDMVQNNIGQEESVVTSTRISLIKVEESGVMFLTRSSCFRCVLQNGIELFWDTRLSVNDVKLYIKEKS